MDTTDAGAYAAERRRLRRARSFGVGFARQLERYAAAEAAGETLTPIQRARLDHYREFLAPPPKVRAERNRRARTSLYLGKPRGTSQPRYVLRREGGRARQPRRSSTRGTRAGPADTSPSGSSEQAGDAPGRPSRHARVAA